MEAGDSARAASTRADAHGQGEEFADLFIAHVGVFRAIAAGVLGRPDLVDDVLQESALTAFRKFDSFQRGTSFAAWMGQIIRFTALNFARKTHRAPTSTESEILRFVPGEAAHPMRPVIDEHGCITIGREAFDDRVLEALKNLEEVPRICLLLRVLNETPYKEISLILDIPEGTAMSHVHRARRALREMLGDRASVSSGDTE